MKHRVTATFELNAGQLEYLQRMAQAHNLPDTSKALRCLLAFAMAEPAQESAIFEVVRCAAPEACPEGGASSEVT